MQEREQECSWSLCFFITVGEQYSTLQSDQAVWQVEARVQIERVRLLFGEPTARTPHC